MISLADSCYIGFDYHSTVVQVCVLDGEGNELGNSLVKNSLIEIFEFIDGVADGRLIRGAAVEACCGASSFAEALLRRDWPIQLAHAGVCARMKQNPDKTDHADAFLLADLCRVGYLPQVWLPPAEIRDLRRLGRHRKNLVEQRRDVKLRVRAMLREERINVPKDVGNVWTKKWLEWVAVTGELCEHSRWVMDELLDDLRRLNDKVKSVEKRMDVATKDDPLVQKLLEIKGVGLVTAVVMRAEIGSFSRFRRGKQLARYCAVTPKNASSGMRQADGGLIKAGNIMLRTLLIETAHRLSRYQPRWKQMKADLVKRGKPASLAAAAIANRWVRRLFWEMKELEVEQHPVAA